ncbi:MAG TPA: DNA-formamidopyrimidine glycosylase family protein [Thermoanaerobaculia bacterium]|nr:DNA-formamidopyrimidine glycosylase family protein [Thermoanaerobaculia bacterium]
MPEGNTIHRLAREQTRDLGGRIVRARSPQGRFAREARQLDRRHFVRADAHGKHLFQFWEGGRIVHVHLGMAGEFYRFEGRAPRPRPGVRMRLAAEPITLDLIGPPTCELIAEPKRLEILARLGPDPLREDADPESARTALWKRPGRAIGEVLLDQRVIAGAGNIYRAEVLFLTGIHPLRPAGRVSQEEWIALWETLGALMRRGVDEGTVTVDPREVPHPRSVAERTSDDDDFYVYGKTICRRCGSKLRELFLSGRRMFFCPNCQPRVRRARPPEVVRASQLQS